MRPAALRQLGYVNVRFSGGEPGHAYSIGETGFAAYLAMPQTLFVLCYCLMVRRAGAPEL
jgi:hypothetical protein